VNRDQIPPAASQDCREVFALLSEYLDVELPPEECSRLREHIERCAPCVEFVESLKKSIELCRKFQPDAVPGPLPEATRQELLAAWKKASS